MNQERDWYTLNETADLLNVTTKTVAFWINVGALREGRRIFLRAMNIGASDKKPQYRITHEALEEFREKALKYIPPAEREEP